MEGRLTYGAGLCLHQFDLLLKRGDLPPTRQNRVRQTPDCFAKSERASLASIAAIVMQSSIFCGLS